MKRQAKPGARARAVGFSLAAAGLISFAGCLIIPVDYYQTGSRHNLNPQTEASLRVGETTKEEVLLLLGEPDLVSDDGQELGYAWTKVKALVFIAAGSAGGGVGGGAASGELERSYVLSVSFDSSNRVTQARLLKE